MKTVFRKLNSKRGVSLLMGLLLLVVAIIVAAVVLSAALTSAQVKKSTMESQQDYLTVSSAVDVFVQELSEMKFIARQKACYAQYGELKEYEDDQGEIDTYWKMLYYKKTGGDSPDTVTELSSYSIPGKIFKNGDPSETEVPEAYLYTKLIKTAVNYVRTAEVHKFSSDFTVAVGYHESKDDGGTSVSSTPLDPVSVSFSMDSDFNFTAVFSLEDKSYSMIVTGTAKLDGESFAANAPIPEDDAESELSKLPGEFCKGTELLYPATPIFDPDNPDNSVGDVFFGADTDDSDYGFILDRHMTLTWENITVNKGNTTTSAVEEEPTT